MVEDLTGCAALWGESYGCDVLTCLVQAERVLETGNWLDDHATHGPQGFYFARSHG